MSLFYDYDINCTWQATQSFTRKSHLTKYPLLRVIQCFIIFWSFSRCIWHIYDVKMSAKWRNLAIFVICFTLQVTQSISIACIHAKSVLYVHIYTTFDEVWSCSRHLWRHKCRENGRNFTILRIVKLGKWLNHLLVTCILPNVLYLKWYNVLLCFGVSSDAYGISMTSECRPNDVIW